MVLTHKPLPNTPPKLGLVDVDLTPQRKIEWLGVHLDPKLKFTDHVNAQVATGIILANWLSSIAITGWGIPLKQFLQLISSLDGKTTGPSRKLQHVNHIAHQFALGVFRIHPTPSLCHNTCLAPAHARLNAKTDTSVPCLLFHLNPTRLPI